MQLNHSPIQDHLIQSLELRVRAAPQRKTSAERRRERGSGEETNHSTDCLRGMSVSTSSYFMISKEIQLLKCAVSMKESFWLSAFRMP